MFVNLVERGRAVVRSVLAAEPRANGARGFGAGCGLPHSPGQEHGRQRRPRREEGRDRLRRETASDWPKRWQLAHAVLWEHSYKMLQLAQLLDQLGAFLTSAL
jgi:hypothetical protein